MAHVHIAMQTNGMSSVWGETLKRPLLLHWKEGFIYIAKYVFEDGGCTRSRRGSQNPKRRELVLLFVALRKCPGY